MNKLKIIGLISLLILTCSACQKKSKQNEIEEIIKTWSNKTIVFPKDIPCMIMGQESDCPDQSSKPYKILLFTDSTGCFSCNLKLSEWKHIIQEVDSLFPGQVDFSFYFHPKSKNELIYVLEIDKFNYPVFADLENKMNKTNHFPDKIEYQCFLLDGKNKVISIGNPTLNENVWELFKRRIAGQ